MTWKGRTYRMDGLNINEQRIVKTLLTTDHIDVTKPFQASEALIAIKLQRVDDGKNVGKGMPNKYRLNYILKKCPQFTASKDAKNMNNWVYTGSVKQ